MKIQTKRILLLVAMLGMLIGGFSISPATAVPSTIENQSPSSSRGGYVDRIIYPVIEGEEQEVLALISGEIDMIGEQMNPTYLPVLLADPDINITITNRKGYGLLHLNTQKAPMNWTAFRRAVAFAIDKEAGAQDIWEGYAEPFDSCIPKSFPAWTIEDELTENYYATNPAKVQEVLLAGGFTLGMDGWWYDPNGVKVDITIWSASSSAIAVAYGQLVAENLQDCNISATAEAVDFNTWLAALYYHGDYDIIFGGRGLPDTMDWLYYEYHSQYWNTTFQNSPGWQNATADTLLEEIISTSNLTRAQELVKELQRVIWYECPMIGMYMNDIISAFRTDKFTHIYTEVGIGTFRFWGKYMIRLNETVDGPFGGTLRVNLPVDIDTTNWLTSSSAYVNDLMLMTYESLIGLDPYDGSVIEGMAYHWNSTVNELNQTIYYFDLYNNVTFHDGHKCNASDVVFTYEFLKDHAAEHVWTSTIEFLHSVEAVSEYTVRMVVNATSVFNLPNTGGAPILPKHLWQGVTNLSAYEPAWPVGTGPYNWTTWVPGEYVQQDFYFDYYKRPVGHDTPSDVAPFDPTLLIIGVAAVGVVVVVAGYFLIRKKPTK